MDRSFLIGPVTREECLRLIFTYVPRSLNADEMVELLNPRNNLYLKIYRQEEEHSDSPDSITEEIIYSRLRSTIAEYLQHQAVVLRQIEQIFAERENEETQEIETRIRDGLQQETLMRVLRGRANNISLREFETPGDSGDSQESCSGEELSDDQRRRLDDNCKRRSGTQGSGRKRTSNNSRIQDFNFNQAGPSTSGISNIPGHYVGPDFTSPDDTDPTRQRPQQEHYFAPNDFIGLSGDLLPERPSINPQITAPSPEVPLVRPVPIHYGAFTRRSLENDTENNQPDGNVDNAASAPPNTVERFMYFRNGNRMHLFQRFAPSVEPSVIDKCKEDHRRLVAMTNHNLPHGCATIRGLQPGLYRYIGSCDQHEFPMYFEEASSDPLPQSSQNQRPDSLNQQESNQNQQRNDEQAPNDQNHSVSQVQHVQNQQPSTQNQPANTHNYQPHSQLQQPSVQQDPNVQNQQANVQNTEANFRHRGFTNPQPSFLYIRSAYLKNRPIKSRDPFACFKNPPISTYQDSEVKPEVDKEEKKYFGKIPSDSSDSSEIDSFNKSIKHCVNQEHCKEQMLKEQEELETISKKIDENEEQIVETPPPLPRRSEIDCLDYDLKSCQECVMLKLIHICDRNSKKTTLRRVQEIDNEEEETEVEELIRRCTEYYMENRQEHFPLETRDVAVQYDDDDENRPESEIRLESVIKQKYFSAEESCNMNRSNEEVDENVIECLENIQNYVEVVEFEENVNIDNYYLAEDIEEREENAVRVECDQIDTTECPVKIDVERVETSEVGEASHETLAKEKEDQELRSVKTEIEKVDSAKQTEATEATALSSFSVIESKEDVNTIDSEEDEDTFFTAEDQGIDAESIKPIETPLTPQETDDSYHILNSEVPRVNFAQEHETKSTEQSTNEPKEGTISSETKEKILPKIEITLVDSSEDEIERPESSENLFASTKPNKGNYTDYTEKKEEKPHKIEAATVASEEKHETRPSEPSENQLLTNEPKEGIHPNNSDDKKKKTPKIEITEDDSSEEHEIERTELSENIIGSTESKEGNCNFSSEKNEEKTFKLEVTNVHSEEEEHENKKAIKSSEEELLATGEPKEDVSILNSEEKEKASPKMEKEQEENVVVVECKNTDPTEKVESKTTTNITKLTEVKSENSKCEEIDITTKSEEKFSKQKSKYSINVVYAEEEDEPVKVEVEQDDVPKEVVLRQEEKATKIPCKTEECKDETKVAGIEGESKEKEEVNVKTEVESVDALEVDYKENEVEEDHCVQEVKDEKEDNVEKNETEENPTETDETEVIKSDQIVDKSIEKNDDEKCSEQLAKIDYKKESHRIASSSRQNVSTKETESHENIFDQPTCSTDKSRRQNEENDNAGANLLPSVESEEKSEEQQTRSQSKSRSRKKRKYRQNVSEQYSSKKKYSDDERQ